MYKGLWASVRRSNPTSLALPQLVALGQGIITDTRYY